MKRRRPLSLRQLLPTHTHLSTLGRFGSIIPLLSPNKPLGAALCAPSILSLLLKSSGVVKPFMPDNLTEQPLLPKDERIASMSSVDVAIIRPPRIATDQSETLVSSGAVAAVYPPHVYSPAEQPFYYGGYDNGIGNWGEYSNYVSANSLQIVPPAMYNGNPSLLDY